MRSAWRVGQGRWRPRVDRQPAVRRRPRQEQRLIAGLAYVGEIVTVQVDELPPHTLRDEDPDRRERCADRAIRIAFGRLGSRVEDLDARTGSDRFVGAGRQTFVRRIG